MAKFKYTALAADGSELRGIVEAKNSKEAISVLRREGLFPTKVRHTEGEVIEDVPRREPKARSIGRGGLYVSGDGT